MASDDEETLYCICREPYDGRRFMIECDKCNDWFHGSCVDIKEHQASDIEIYHCPQCQNKFGPLVLKRKRTSHRRDYSESDENISKTQTGTVKFITELKSRRFASAEGLIVYLTDGYELDREFLDETDFRYPIIVFNREGLDLKVPPSSFSIQDVESHIGSMREIDVIDVSKQEDFKMLMREWTQYYTSSVRQRVLNVISLEFSKTKLATLVEPPRIVRELSWVNQYWPEPVPECDQMYEKPHVQKYCLMSIKDSYTDFHIDFGGTSVWYHVLRGEKVFYLVEPTPVNLQLYETWISSANQSEVFFGDQVVKCYKCVIKQGQTFFIPTGWIHAVLTPIDSLVFGGNFLQSYNIPLQIEVYEIEKRTRADKKYLFPNYETLHWYAAQGLLKILQNYTRLKKEPPLHLATGVRALVKALKDWTRTKDVSGIATSFMSNLDKKRVHIKRDQVPNSIQYGKLLRDLEKEIRHMTRSAKKERHSTSDGDGFKKQGGGGGIKEEDSGGGVKKEDKWEPNQSDLDESQDFTSSQSDFDTDVKTEEEEVEKKDLSDNSSCGKNTVGAMLRHIHQAASSSKNNSNNFTIAHDNDGGVSGLSSSQSRHKPAANPHTLPTERDQTMQCSQRYNEKSQKSQIPLLSPCSLLSPIKKTAASSSSPSSSLGSPPAGSGAGQSRLSFRLPKSDNVTVTAAAVRSRDQSQSSDLSVYDFDIDDNDTNDNNETRDSNFAPTEMSSECSGSELGSPLGSPSSYGSRSPARARFKSESGSTATGVGSGDALRSPLRPLTVKLPTANRVQGMTSPGDRKRGNSSGGGRMSQSSEDESNGQEQLVVDETPKKRRRQAPAGQSSSRWAPVGLTSGLDDTSDVDIEGDSSAGFGIPSATFGNRLGEPGPALDPSAAVYEEEVQTSEPGQRQSASVQAAVQAMLTMSRGASDGAAPGPPGTSSSLQSAELGKCSRANAPLGKSLEATIQDNLQSASMQAAVQAMLTMSRGGGDGVAPGPPGTSSLQSAGTVSPFVLDRARATQRLQRESKARALRLQQQGESVEERLATAYKDDEYVYPTLAESDNEDEASRSRGSKDEAWNPRGKVTSSVPRNERQPRLGARKESVECQLEDAAAKLANKPAPKRNYVKKKPRPEGSSTGAMYDSLPSKKHYDYSPSSPGPLYMDYGSPSTSTSVRSHPSSAQAHSASKKVSSSSSKKGSTAKQRLGKILGIHKMGLF